MTSFLSKSLRLSLLASAVMLAPCHGSALTPEEESALQGGLPVLPAETWREIYDRLPAQDIVSGALVCKEFHTSYQKEVTDLVNPHISNMMTESPLLKRASPLLKEAVHACLEEKGLVYLPSCLKGMTLEGASTFNMDDLGAIYEALFGVEKKTFTDLDLLCVEAYLPLKQLFFKEGHREEAFQALCQNLQAYGKTAVDAPLLRFDAALMKPELFEASRTLVMTSRELANHKDELSALWQDKMSPTLHVVAEEDGGFVHKGAFSMSARDLPTGMTSLILSDPRGKIQEMKGHFLSKHLTLQSLEMRNFSALETILPGFFRECTGLTAVNLGDFPSLKEIGDFFFVKCTGLPAINLSHLTSVEKIGHYFFNGCTGLTTVNLGDLPSLETIGRFSFDRCNALPEEEKAKISAVLAEKTVGF